jgi:hypothetical protein
MKPATSERLDDRVATVRHLQNALGAERPNVPLPAFLLCRLAIDVDDAVNRPQHQAAFEV